MIRLTQLSKSYDGGESWAVRDVSLTVEEGELVALLGASGCGKTTTLKMINRLVEPTRGRIEVDGADVALGDPVELRRKIGYVFQGIGLFPHLTVGENVGLVPRLLGWPEEQRARRIDELLELVGLSPGDYRDRPSRSLSGGQQQRVGVARALAARSRVVLMDEPFGAVDPVTRDVLQREYRALHEQMGLTTVMVTHDMTEALLLADRIVVMDAGHVVGEGTPASLLRDPGHPRIEELVAAPRRQAELVERLLSGSPSLPTLR